MRVVATVTNWITSILELLNDFFWSFISVGLAKTYGLYCGVVYLLVKIFGLFRVVVYLLEDGIGFVWDTYCAVVGAISHTIYLTLMWVAYTIYQGLVAIAQGTALNERGSSGYLLTLY